MSKPIIIHVINNMGIGGAEVLLANTIPLLRNYDHILVCLASPDTLRAKIQPYLKEFYLLKVDNKSQWIKGIRKIRNIINHHQPVLVHSHLQVSSLLTRMACPAKIPMVFSVHSTFSEDAFKNNKLAVLLEQLTVRKRHSIIGVSRFVINDYLEAVPFKGKTFTLYNFVLPKFFNSPVKDNPVSGEVLKLVAVGTLKDAKNYPFLLAAFSMLRMYPVHIDIYGDGPEREMLQELIDKDNLNVTLKGSSDQLERLLPQYDAYIISSKHEGYGIAPLEAMACGLPVLASSIPVLKEVIGDDNALFFELDDSSHLANQIKNVIDNKTLLAVYSDKSKQRALQIASEEKYLADLNLIYKTIING